MGGRVGKVMEVQNRLGNGSCQQIFTFITSNIILNEKLD